MTEDRFDLVVIGSGPAGEKAAAQAAYVGKRVAVVERDEPGGAAVRQAVIPSKTLRETAQYLTGFRRRNVYGVSLSLDPTVTIERLQARRAAVGDAMADAVRRNLEAHGIELIIGHGRLEPGRLVRVGERLLQADVILIATGARPFHPPDVPFEDPDVHDSEEILVVDRIPESIVVVGGGVIGTEYASVFVALGSKVTLVHAGPLILPSSDHEISRRLAETFESYGMRVVTGRRAESITREAGGVAVNLEGGESIVADKVLFSLGQVGNTEGLGLAAAGVRADDRGRIAVDESYRTTAEGIYAAGDVIGPPALASVGMEQGRVAVCHAFDIPFKLEVDPLIPMGVYTIPEVASVGISEERARELGIDHEVGRSNFLQNTRAQIGGFTDGFLKLVFRREDRVLLGVHILGDAASELIHLGQAAIADGHPIDRFIHATFNVPTRSDAYKYAAYDGLQRLSGKIIDPD
ncbi:MAG: Si-specific NAD(P)(+) transhydrogenase [Actinobacteria bacterium]|nr:Si-specific NAD(P)(+) transhydrogenase [Actinomycetota bacterium]